MKKTMIILLALLQMKLNAMASDLGTWEIDIPKNIRTLKDYERVQKIRKRVFIFSIVGTAASFGLYKYAQRIDKKASGIQIAQPFLVNGPLGPYSPTNQTNSDRVRHLQNQEAGVRTAAVVLGLAAVFGFGVTLSLRF